MGIAVSETLIFREITDGNIMELECSMSETFSGKLMTLNCYTVGESLVHGYAELSKKKEVVRCDEVKYVNRCIRLAVTSIKSGRVGLLDIKSGCIATIVGDLLYITDNDGNVIELG